MKGCKHKWGVIRTIWPYEPGYGVYCKKCKTLLESGLSKDKAEQAAMFENEQGREE